MLLAFAEREIKLSKRQKDGGTLRDHLTAAYRQTGRKHDLLSDLPCGMFDYIWIWFCELDSARSATDFGLNPLTYQEISSWASLTERNINRYDVGLIKKIDTMRLSKND